MTRETEKAVARESPAAPAITTGKREASYADKKRVSRIARPATACAIIGIVVTIAIEAAPARARFIARV